MVGAGIFSAIGTAAVGEVAADGTVLTLGFISVFGVFGIIHEQFTQSFKKYTPQATIAIGLVLFVGGL